MERLSKIGKYKIKVYLENLRRSGKTNMFGAAPYLADEFGFTMEEAITELIEWLQNYEPSDYRICECCGKAISAGFDIAFGLEYYCSEKCLYSVYSEKEYNELYEADTAYYTEWYE